MTKMQRRVVIRWIKKRKDQKNCGKKKQRTETQEFDERSSYDENAKKSGKKTDQKKNDQKNRGKEKQQTAGQESDEGSSDDENEKKDLDADQ
jgi:hypothetical protein